MRILFISNHYPPYEVGGYEQLCRDVAEAFRKRGHTVAVLTSDRGGGSTEAEAGGIYRALRIVPDYGARMGPALQFFLTRRRDEAHDLRALRSTVAAFSPEVIFVWNLQGLPYEMATAAEALPGVVTAYWLAGYTPREPDMFWRYWSQMPNKRSGSASLKRILGQLALAIMRREGKPARPEMRHVAVVSDYMRKSGIAAGTLPEQTQVIYNGVELEQFTGSVSRQADSALSLLYAGRVSPDKGVDTAIRALGLLAQEHGLSAIRLSIAGQATEPYLQQLHELADSLGVASQVAFLGQLPREAVPDLMREHHVLLLPTVHQEPFARVVLEAMASGMVVVGTLTGGTGEILEHELTGLTFAAGDAGDLAHQIARLVEKPDLRLALAARAQERVAKGYSFERMVERLERFLLAALAEAGPPNDVQEGPAAAHQDAGRLRTLARRFVPLWLRKMPRQLFWLAYDARDYLAEVVGRCPFHGLRLAAYRHLLGIRIGESTSVHRRCASTSRRGCASVRIPSSTGRCCWMGAAASRSATMPASRRGW